MRICVQILLAQTKSPTPVGHYQAVAACVRKELGAHVCALAKIMLKLSMDLARKRCINYDGQPFSAPHRVHIDDINKIVQDDFLTFLHYVPRTGVTKRNLCHSVSLSTKVRSLCESSGKGLHCLSHSL